MTHRTWLEISSAALLHNMKEFFGLISDDVKFMAVVKANAYGHGILEVSKTLLALRSFSEGGWFGVDSLDEALALRTSGITQPILTLGYVPLDRLSEAVEQGIRLTVYNKEAIEMLGKVQSSKFKVQNKSQLPNYPITKLHLKLETGTNRQGLLPQQALELIKLIQQYPHLQLEGISSHFANIEDTTDHSFALEQLKRFHEALNLLFPASYPHHPNGRNNPNHPSPLRHMGATAATILMPETHFDMVRVGIGLYGLWPSRETLVARKAVAPPPSPLQEPVPSLSREEGQGEVSPNLKPVLSWKTRIAQIKTVTAGESVGYGLSERVPQNSRIAILPMGYYDGYDRKLGSLGNVLIGGTRCKILGRIGMNMCMADITHVQSAKVEDEVVLIGEQSPQGLSLPLQGETLPRNPPERITVDELAQKIGTINYEVVARINPLLPRVVV